MTFVDIVLARLLFAALGTLVTGCAVWAMTMLCLKRFPALAEQRSLWLVGQLAVAGFFVAMLLPQTEALRLVPVIVLDDNAPAQLATSPAPAAVHTAKKSAPAPSTKQGGIGLVDVAHVWLLVYLIGLGYTGYRQWQARRLLHALVAGGHRITAQDGHPGLAAQTAALLPPVIEIEAPISPMLHGLLTPRLLLPRHLRSFDPVQQQLIVEHELTHWRRRDLYVSAAALLLQNLFWFNPFLRMLRARLAWSQEFGCDRDVLRGRPQAERKAYATALVAQLKLQQQPTGMALAFGASGEPTLVARVQLIRAPASSNSPWPRFAALGALAAVVCANLALQPALGLRPAGAADSQSSLLTQILPAAAAGAPSKLDCLVMVDAATGDSLVREGTCDELVTPASTFKIAISLMGFDSGVLRDDHSPYLPYKARYASDNPAWRHGTDPAGWLRESIVWYSQQVTSQLGAARIRSYVRAFDYGNGDLASVPGMDDAIALSEVSPTLRITPIEQTVFLRKVVNRSLPLSEHAFDVTARLLKGPTLANGWEVHGKTGTASMRLADGSADETQDLGWYVGWAIKDGRTVVFARLLQHKVGNGRRGGLQARETFLGELARRAL